MERYLKDAIKTLSLDRGKMAFISGPRQVGKTTLSLSYKPQYNQLVYKNWDESTFRRQWLKNPNEILESFNPANVGRRRLLVLDEIHKAKGWKQKLKGLYDTNSNEIEILVTGSAKLNVFRKGGDSLMGRVLNFRLHPLSFGEVYRKQKSPILSPEAWRDSLFTKPTTNPKNEILDQLMTFGGFPEPFFAQDHKIANIWRKDRVEKVIREDLRDLSRLPELSQVEMLASLLPTKVGSPLSVTSLREDLEVSHGSVTRWMNYLSELYYHFSLRPWTKSIARSLKKEPKIYLFDWTEVEDMGPRFENMTASHLLKACHYWTDTGEGNFDLFYLRNKEQQEVDFLIVKNQKPWLAVEAKTSSSHFDKKTFEKFQRTLTCPFIQVTNESGVWKQHSPQLLMLSASLMFQGLP